MEAGSHECVACGTVLRATTVRCGACGTDVVEGAVPTRSATFDAAAVLVDPARQRTTALLLRLGLALVVIGSLLSIGTSAWWGLIGAVVYVGYAALTAPAVLSDPAATGGGAGMAGFANVGLGLSFGLAFPLAALLLTDSARGKVAMGVLVASTLVTWTFHARRETDAEGFGSVGVPTD